MNGTTKRFTSFNVYFVTLLKSLRAWLYSSTDLLVAINLVDNNVWTYHTRLVLVHHLFSEDGKLALLLVIALHIPLIASKHTYQHIQFRQWIVFLRCNQRYTSSSKPYGFYTKPMLHILNTQCKRHKTIPFLHFFKNQSLFHLLISLKLIFTAVSSIQLRHCTKSLVKRKNFTIKFYFKNYWNSQKHGRRIER